MIDNTALNMGNLKHFVFYDESYDWFIFSYMLKLY